MLANCVQIEDDPSQMSEFVSLIKKRTEEPNLSLSISSDLMVLSSGLEETMWTMSSF